MKTWEVVKITSSVSTELAIGYRNLSLEQRERYKSLAKLVPTKFSSPKT